MIGFKGSFIEIILSCGIAADAAIVITIVAVLGILFISKWGGVTKK